MHVVITGANRGIGRALFDHYRALGHSVTGTARNDAEFARLDVSDPDSVTAFAQGLAGQPVDLLICNAGFYGDKHHKLDGGYPAEMWAETFATNVTGVFLTIQALLPNLRAAPGARIAIISSQMASHTRAPGRSFIYCASKAAALNLGRNLAVDLKPEGIAVGIYHPGWVRTDMGGEAGDISAEESASGLAERFDALDADTTGCFQTWDGRDHPF
ncbi:NADP-dependent 3-hydroxy acid dehydrogenase YdfG [Roseovarius halotolerans]|uniref:C-factor n=1 Tax=Roseovarius halotolerans TaxID=505353 RepID=A0A1X6ZHE2_9RHOB|nr:SDR family NAD(P)-dependent oxidoreductase [Roseovarius halotolerans]RKT30897.1 NADP-dependent 3-hydroxy acid dehydrogenase YdfG [Roseovarius halotolerans]SLN51128.1 C-factor [Roseovarius halotolerans]